MNYNAAVLKWQLFGEEFGDCVVSLTGRINHGHMDKATELKLKM